MLLSVSYSYRVLLCQLGLERPDGMAPFRSEQAAPCQGAGTVHICKWQLFISKVVPTHFHKVFSLPWPTHSRILMSKVTAGRPRSCHTSKCAAQRFARSSSAAGATGMLQCLLRSLPVAVDGSETSLALAGQSFSSHGSSRKRGANRMDALDRYCKVLKGCEMLRVMLNIVCFSVT